MQKSEALELCQQCPNFMKKGYCDYYAIEGARLDDIEPPACLKELLTLIKISRIRASEKSRTELESGAQSQAPVFQPVKLTNSSVAKEPSSEGSEGTGKVAKAGAYHPPAPTDAIEIVAIKPESIDLNGSLKGSQPSKVRESDQQAETKMVADRKNLVAKSECTWLPSEQSDPRQQHAEGGAVQRKQIRLHAQEWNILILWKDERYRERIGKIIFDDGNTIRCYREKIEVYSGQSFFSDDAQKATANSIEYWNRFFVRLENDLKIILVKPRAQNIKLVKQEYAEVGNELATRCEMNGNKIRVYANEDGKLWFTIDNSFNLREAETQHHETAEEDMQNVVAPYFNDLRDKRPPLPSEVWNYLAQTTHHIQEIGAGLSILVNARLPHEIQVAPEKKPEDKWSKIYG